MPSPITPDDIPEPPPWLRIYIQNFINYKCILNVNVKCLSICHLSRVDNIRVQVHIHIDDVVYIQLYRHTYVII